MPWRAADWNHGTALLVFMLRANTSPTGFLLPPRRLSFQPSFQDVMTPNDIESLPFQGLLQGLFCSYQDHRDCPLKRLGPSSKVGQVVAITSGGKTFSKHL